MTLRPPFIVSARELRESAHAYPQSTEPISSVRRPGKAAGLVRTGANLQRLSPGTRSSWPHAEEHEEEFVYVLEGEVDAWSRTVQRARPSDVVVSDEPRFP